MALVGANAGAASKDEVIVGGTAQDGKSGMVSVTHGDGRTTEHRRIVEGTVVKVPAWTGVGNKRKWLADLIDACKTCSGRTDNLERGWILEVLKPEVVMVSLEETWTGDPAELGRFTRLDNALKLGLKDIINTKTTRTKFLVDRSREKELTSEDGSVKSLNGRQILWCFFDEKTIESTTTHHVKLKRLHDLTLPNDQGIELFV